MATIANYFSKMPIFFINLRILSGNHFRKQYFRKNQLNLQLISGNNVSGRQKLFCGPVRKEISAQSVWKSFSGKCFLDWAGINFFADRSAKTFLPAGNIISGKTKLKISWISAESAVYFVFPEILFPEASLKWFYSVKLRTDYDNFCMILAYI